MIPPDIAAAYLVALFRLIDLPAAHEPRAKPHVCERVVFSAEVLRVIDGDTFVARVHLGMDVTRTTAIRIVGIDTPEIHGDDRERARAATEFARAWLASYANVVEIVDHGDDKFGGRRDAEVYAPGGVDSLAEALRAAGLEKR